MNDSLIFGLGLAIFFGAHLFAAFRPRGDGDLPSRIGAGLYRGLFSLATLAGLVLIVIGYDALRGLTPVWDPPFWTRHVPITLMLPAMILFVAAEAPMGHIKRVVRHPMLAGVKLWAFSHLVANGDLASALLFGSFLAFAVLDRIVVKRRAPPASPSPQAALRGDIIAVGFGLLLYGVIVFWAHAALIGIPVIA